MDDNIERIRKFDRLINYFQCKINKCDGKLKQSLWLAIRHEDLSDYFLKKSTKLSCRLTGLALAKDRVREMREDFVLSLKTAVGDIRV